ncbi:propanediol utilization protein [Roseivivax sediminis]|uniref:Protein involved in propanediol utilization n=1 Tax=Roseivivax sediminis TaxID=936889 RepID=A0A1I1U5I5_9RHOB|nr:propanediol utilization protein [Roseivivax sediminis]SFD63973.1 Protein involved in propanediol utilization [Roseivivax sediminis]
MRRIAGHFGEWLQGRSAEGPLALVTVACDALAVTAERLSDGPLSLDQVPQFLTDPQAARMLEALGKPSGRYRLRADMPPGGGAGASTAALLALAGDGAPDALARACLSVEEASDPLMHARPDSLLWAPREARILRRLPPPPRAEIVGGFFGPPVRTDAADCAFPDVSDLIAAWEAGPDLATAAGIAATSAARTTALRGPHDDPSEALARETGALGHLRAHTGSARGLIFAPGTVPAGAEAALTRAGFTGVIRFETGGAA